ncbi:hypothetical protein MtrunA17_Chr2g0311851 [Medicago truncatula]|uniref:Uncharacterized protein n=1 Tax=Medicago truncatula TaxID=3880 RepID=A0A396JE35_MEDTR|nr:hypothetical protein MtrunA17_Chr2g0311851 [Medicago truncatula]
MKHHCDEKREVYEYMIIQPKEKGKSNSGKGEHITSRPLQAAHDEYEEEATLAKQGCPHIAKLGKGRRIKPLKHSNFNERNCRDKFRQDPCRF